MSLEINITPTMEDNGNGCATTYVQVVIDLTSIKKQLKKYDVLIQTHLVVTQPDKQEGEVYEYAQIYRDVKEDTIQFTTIVLGYITDIKDIKSSAKAVFMKKLKQ